MLYATKFITIFSFLFVLLSYDNVVNKSYSSLLSIICMYEPAFMVDACRVQHYKIYQIYIYIFFF